MKHMKKFTAMLLAVIMVLGMALSVSADGTDSTDGYTITIEHAEATQKHTYGAYQIFTGDLHTTTEDGKEVKVLSNIVWGSGIDEAGKTALLEEYQVDTAAELAEILESEADAKAFAEAVAQHLTGTPAQSTADADNQVYTIKVSDAGYYLIKDMETITGHDSYTRYMMKVVADVKATHKNSVPTVDKQVWDEDTDDDAGDDANWGETADHNLNESFKFKLIANLPKEIAFDAYDTYKVVFNDTMSDGITFESIEEVVVDGVKLTGDQYTHNGSADKQSWTLTIDDIKCITGVNLKDGATVEVIYNAHLNENAVISNPGNKNTVFLQYSNNPNATGEGEELGKTNEDTVWVFTYDIDAKKVDGKDKTTPLAGAKFKLYRENGTTKEYVTLEYVNSEDAYKVTGWKADETQGTEITTLEKGLVKIIGLDHGTYYLKETKAPAGYNLLTDAIKIEISAVHAEEANGAVTNVLVNNGSEDTVIQVENNAGVTLPETGGMGTTMFYAVGAVLVLAAVVLLVTKRRMRAE